MVVRKFIILGGGRESLYKRIAIIHSNWVLTSRGSGQDSEIANIAGEFLEVNDVFTIKGGAGFEANEADRISISTSLKSTSCPKQNAAITQLHK